MSIFPLKVEVQIKTISTTVHVLIMLCQLTVDYDLLYLSTNHFNALKINYFANTADLFNDSYNKCNNSIRWEESYCTHSQLLIIANFKTLA